jgi:tRNA threonylcarbamoyl adenosine modification protein YeaZ/ribosomal-protein-alanine acetyltransferase
MRKGIREPSACRMKFYMLVLALDTTTRRGSAAVLRDAALLDHEVGDPARAYGERLPADIIRLLARCGLALREIDLFAVAAGPGSFTGLRIGIATMQGLAMANGRPMAGVSTLDALQRAAAPSSAFVGAFMDAQRGEVFSALYRDGRLVDGPAAETPDVTLARWRALATPGPLAFVGDGALAYADAIAAAFPAASRLPEAPALAPAIGLLAWEAAARGEAVSPEAIRPVYVRRRHRGSGQAMSWTIERTLSEADVEEIAAIEAAAFSNPWTLAMYQRELQNPDVSFLYVLRLDNRIVGFCSFWLVLDEVHINNLAIRPEYQGQGLGTVLLKEVLQVGSNRGAERATLEVRRSNTPARRLYENLGFEVAATRPNYYVSPPEDALILWKGGLNCVTFRP